MQRSLTTDYCLLTTVYSILRREARAVFDGVEEGFDHLGLDEVAVKLVELVEPELPAAEVRVLRVVGVAPQVAEVLHQDEGAVLLARAQVGVLGHLAQDARTPLRLIGRARQLRDELVALRLRE